MKNPFLKKKISLQEKIAKTTTKVADKLVSKKLKGKTLDQKAAVIRRLIPMERVVEGGIAELRKRVIAGAEEEIRECIEKGMSDEEILQPCKDSPNYLALLEELDLNLEHIKVIIKEQRKVR